MDFKYKYQVAYDVTQKSQDTNGLHVWSVKAEEKASTLGKKVHDLLFELGTSQMGSTFLIYHKRNFSAESMLYGILNYFDAGKEYFTDSERAHIIMTVADVSQRDTNEERLATHNI